MIAIERRNRILEKLQEDRKVIVSELSQLYNVSEETIRRDLEKLEKDGLCIKSYGGAVLNENNNIDMPFNVRKKNNILGKQKIAELIAAQVEEGDHIILDASTTAIYIAKALKCREHLTIITNSIEILIELSDMPGWNVISLGGSLKEGFLAMVGTTTIASVEAYNVEKTILSCKAFDVEKGFSDTSEEFAKTKQAMLRSGKERVLAVDSTKFGKQAFARFANLGEIDVLVTDVKPDQEFLEKCDQVNVRCLYPNNETGSI